MSEKLKEMEWYERYIVSILLFLIVILAHRFLGWLGVVGVIFVEISSELVRIRENLEEAEGL